MRPRHIALIIGLSLTACTQAGAANEGKIGELSEQLAEANRKLDEVSERLGAIEAKLEAREQRLEEAREQRRIRRETRGDSPALSLGPAIDPEKLKAGVSCPKEDRCTIDRELLDEMLQNPTSLARSARVVPAVRDGETRGFKVYGIRPGSVLKLLNFKNGDMITSINGKALDSIEDAMGTYTEVRGAREIEVGYERKGEGKTMRIEIK